MLTKKDFIATAKIIKGLPKSKRQFHFDESVTLFKGSNPRFDVRKFADACNVEYVEPQSYTYTPPPPETITEPPVGPNHLRVVGTGKPVGRDHWDVYLNDVYLGYIYKCYYTYDGAVFNSDKKSPYHTLIRHVHDGSYSGIYRLCLILNAYHLNSDNTMSVNTPNHLGWIVIKPDGLTTPNERPTDGMRETYDVYKNYRCVGQMKYKWGEYVDTDNGIFIKEQMDVLYPQVAVTHATSWFYRKDAQRIARKVNGKAVRLSKFRQSYWEASWEKQSLEAREKEFATARERLNKGYY